MKKSFILVCAFLLVLPLYAHAQVKEMDRDQVFSLLEEAYLAQVSLSEELRTRQEINDILSAYFTEEYSKDFWEANVVEENGEYITYGTDFAQYYIPYYHFSENTKVVSDQDKIYVFEYFPESSEGPVGYSSHYEGLLLEKTNENWKVSQYLYDDIPESVIAKAEAPLEVSLVGVSAGSPAFQEVDEVETASIQFQLGMNPIGNLVQFGALVSSGSQNSLQAFFENNKDQVIMEY